MSVKDLDQAGPGRAWFDGLRHRLTGASTIIGMENLGFPAFETRHGDVVFLKDHKTLWVDATGITTTSLPAGTSPTDLAYGVAAAVVACWSKQPPAGPNSRLLVGIVAKDRYGSASASAQQMGR